MKIIKYVLSTILLSFALTAQTILTENFNSFLDTTSTANTVNLFNFDSTYSKMGIDYTSNSHDLTWSVGAAAWRDSVFEGNPLIFGGLHHKMPATGYWSRTSESSQNPGSSKFFMLMIVKIDKALSQYDWFGKLVWSGTAWNGFALSLTTTPRIEFTIGDGISHKVVQYNYNYIGQGWLAIAGVQNADSAYIYINGEKVASALSTSYNITTNLAYTLGGRNYFGGRIAYFRQENYTNLTDAEKKIKEISSLATKWVSKNGNVTRDLSNPDFFLTAWSDTLCVPLPDATLGNNQEWVLTSSNIDDVTAWIGSRSSAKSVKKSIMGGVLFASNTTYFGDGFSLVSDSLVVVFPADTASIDNIVIKKAQHHLIPKDWGSPAW